MRIDPDQAYPLFLLAIKFRDSGDRARSHGVISTQRERNTSGFQGLDHQLGKLGAGGSDFFQILRVSVAFFFLLGNGNSDVPAIFHLMAERFESGLKTGHTYSRRTHVDAAARLP